MRQTGKQRRALRKDAGRQTVKDAGRQTVTVIGQKQTQTVLAIVWLMIYLRGNGVPGHRLC